ncbi:nuclear protein UL24 [Aotine betaherpesvirus 1]|uniref:Nuclear protein UL24 n=1 Tax=Aotine betaherpesvirus 1 TaxID=50290 RepID=G8XUE2_9BETA|nr:nuclear protein UL24 [Aotine betaherpesvirus 1]AEV80772.1 nuclear protein UL24 [Aotine betaherpesvirus 1]
MSSPPEKSVSLSDLPRYRAIAGKRKHFAVYRQIVKTLNNFQRFNLALGGVFPPGLAQCRRSVFFEVTVGRRIPDCLVLFSSEGLVRKIVCYVFELKTTQSSADADSVRKHSSTHYLQYVQGLRQLKDTVDDLRGFSSGAEGDVWDLIPVIVFYPQNEARPSFCRAFRVTTLRFRTESLVRVLCRGQDESVRNILSSARAQDRARSRARRRARVHSGGVRRARRECPVGPGACTSAPVRRYRYRAKKATR